MIRVTMDKWIDCVLTPRIERFRNMAFSRENALSPSDIVLLDMEGVSITHAVHDFLVENHFIDDEAQRALLGRGDYFNFTPFGKSELTPNEVRELAYQLDYARSYSEIALKDRVNSQSAFRHYATLFFKAAEELLAFRIGEFERNLETLE